MELTTPHSKNKPRVAALVGATAVGKTAVALALAAELQAPRSSTPTPSRSTGSWTSAPPSPRRRSGPGRPTTSSTWPTPRSPMTRPATAGKGGQVLADLQRRGVPPLVVGGTGLYLKALLRGLFAEGEPGPGSQGAAAPGVGGPGAARPVPAPGRTWTRPPPPGSTPTTPTGSSGPWR